MVLRHFGRMTDVTRVMTAPGHESHTQRTKCNGPSRYGVPKGTNLRFSYGLYLGQSESPGLLVAACPFPIRRPCGNSPYLGLSLSDVENSHCHPQVLREFNFSSYFRDLDTQH